MSPSNSPSSRLPASLWVAIVGSGIFALAFLIVGIGALVQRHGRFSAGVGAMLLLYGAFVALAAWGAWRGASLSRGGIVTAALIHLFMGQSIARNGQPLAWLAFALALVTLVAAVTPASTRALLDEEDLTRA